MNILLDQNISFRVVTLLSGAFENVKQVRELGLTDFSDIEIWSYARKNDYCVITFDSDFVDLANLKGSPPKIIWLRFGNSTNLKIANKLLLNAEVIKSFLTDDSEETAFLEID